LSDVQPKIKEEIGWVLNKQKEFYETLFNNIPADIVAFDKNHKYLSGSLLQLYISSK
jgi:hypothetical protein